jgi:competence protein ComEA
VAELPDKRFLVDEPLDLNTATREELIAIKGIGEGLADRILAWRARHGRFKAVGDLQHIPEIGPDGLRELKHHFKV